MPFAVIQTGGKQHRVEPGQTIAVEKLLADEGQTVELTEVLLVSDDSGVRQGRPLVDGAKVIARVVEQTRGPKIIVFKYKPKVRYRKKTGHRQALTRITIQDIVAGDGVAAHQETAAPQPEVVVPEAVSPEAQAPVPGL
jgi:large subunit ribosomal protein L21